MLSYCALFFVSFEESLGVHGGHAARASCRDSLTITVILDIASDEHPWDIGEGTVFGYQVAVGVHLQFPFEHNAVGIVTDCYK